MASAFAVGFYGWLAALIVASALLVFSLRAWTQNRPSWKWHLGLSLPVFLGANLLAWVMMGRLSPPLLVASLVVFGCTLGVVLSRAARVSRRSAFTEVLVAYSVLTVFGAFLAAAMLLRSCLPPCYCPVRRRSSGSDLVLRPLYAWRRNRLRNRLEEGPAHRSKRRYDTCSAPAGGDGGSETV